MSAHKVDVSNTDNVIDSRDVIARIEELEGSLTVLECTCDVPPDNSRCGTCDQSWCNRCHPAPSARCPYEHEHDERAELASLLSLQSEAEDYSEDWRYGSQLIRDSYFKTYAQELADDCGLLPKDAKWPCTHIDWEAAAGELKQDYTQVSFDGEEYWVR